MNTNKQFYSDRRVVIHFVNGKELIIRNILQVTPVDNTLVYDCPNRQYTILLDKVVYAVVENDMADETVPKEEIEKLFCYDKNGCALLRPIRKCDITDEDRRIHSLIVEQLKESL